MFTLQIVVGLLMVSAYSAIQVAPSPGIPCLPGLCPPQRPCNHFEYSPIYTNIDGQCRIFQNDCYMRQENCRRITICKPPVIVIDQEECKKLYLMPCTDAKSYVCAYFPTYNDIGIRVYEKKSMPSLCELNKYASSLGLIYEYYTPGPCDSLSTA